ncbi:MAG TPA: phosphoribosyl-AMP cyclohydrolase, partial [Propionicimonas sp.]|nr:phosphoribosyl-AMP cyclohydrolase [Propionicimonas sp.]
MTELNPDVAALLKRNPDGLVPAIVQDATDGRVLMLAWMDDEALRRT